MTMTMRAQMTLMNNSNQTKLAPIFDVQQRMQYTVRGIW